MIGIMNYSKGEWKHKLTENGSFITCKGTRICKLMFEEPMNYNELMCNGRLLSSAPDLFEALIAIMEAEGGEPNYDNPQSVDAWNLATEAIKKAILK